jgi:transposase-like protein
MQTEDLNIRNNTRLLVLKALNKYELVRDAAAALGISKRQLSRWIKEFEIKRGGRRDFYFKPKVFRIVKIQQKQTA